MTNMAIGGGGGGRGGKGLEMLHYLEMADFFSKLHLKSLKHVKLRLKIIKTPSTAADDLFPLKSRSV